MFTLIPLFPMFSQEGTEPSKTEEDFLDDELEIMEDEGLTVVGTQETTQQMKVIEQEDIQRRNAPDLATLLQETLDLGVMRYGGYGNQTNITMRGFDSERIAFLIDGIPLNSPLDGEFDINQIDLLGIEYIEVIYGGSDSKYNVSGALGGVINIVTMKKQKPGLRIGAGVSNTSVMPGTYRNREEEKMSPHWEDLVDAQKYSLSAGYGGKNFSLTARAFANRAENHFIFKDSYNITRRKDNNEVWDTGASASLIWELPDLTKLIASSNFYYGDKNIPTSGFSRDFGVQQDSSFRQNLMLDMPRAFRDDLATEASLTWYLTNREYEPPSGTASQHTQHSLSAINRWTWYPFQKITFGTGFDYRFIYLDSTNIGSRDRHDGGYYLNAEYKPVAAFLIVSSIKAVFCTTGSQPVTPVPKLGFAFTPLDSFTIKNNYFRSFKYPDFEDLYWQGGGGIGNPNLKPEDGWGGDLGADYRYKELWTMESTFSALWTEDSIHWDQGADKIWKPYNVGEAMFFGLDNKFRITIPVKLGPVEKISPGISYQYMRSYLLSGDNTWESDKRIPYMPEHTLGLSLDISWGSGSALVSAHYETSRYAKTDNSTELDPYFLLTLNVNQNIGKNLSAFASLRNITNTSYESFEGYPMPGFNFTLGLRAAFDVPEK
jgi:vitamin B12 transporter